MLCLLCRGSGSDAPVCPALCLFPRPLHSHLCSRFLSTCWVPAALTQWPREGRNIITPPSVDGDAESRSFFSSFPQQIFVEDLLCARHHSRLQQYSSEQNRQQSLPMRSLHFSGERQEPSDHYLLHLIGMSAVETKADKWMGRLGGRNFLRMVKESLTKMIYLNKVLREMRELVIFGGWERHIFGGGHHTCKGPGASKLGMWKSSKETRVAGVR